MTYEQKKIIRFYYLMIRRSDEEGGAQTSTLAVMILPSPDSVLFIYPIIHTTSLYAQYEEVH